MNSERLKQLVATQVGQTWSMVELVLCASPEQTDQLTGVFFTTHAADAGTKELAETPSGHLTGIEERPGVHHRRAYNPLRSESIFAWLLSAR